MNSKSASFRPSSILAVLLVFFSIVMSALVSRTVFERLPHLEDEVAYLFQARIFARGDLVVETPQPRRAYWQPFVVDFDETGNRFGKYTPGWPALLAVGVLLGQPWVVNAFLAGITVALVYRLGRDIFNPETGVIAAALTAFSPMALLLNATLMGHTAALCFTTLFLYAYWRMERGRQPLKWGLIAGTALGLIIINRPLTAIGVAAPLVVWSNIQLIKSFFHMVESESRRFVMERLCPLLALGAVALLISTAIPSFNFAATGDPMTNLYTLVWDYDMVGFGEGYGRNGHTLEKGIRQARFDLSLMAADLYGWQMEITTNREQLGTFIVVRPAWGPGYITPELQQHLLTEGDYWPLVGISWIFLPFGLVVGIRQSRWFMAVWILLAALILLVTIGLPPNTLQDPTFSSRWLVGVFAWMSVPQVMFALRQTDSKTVWTWLLFSLALALVTVHLAYWIGSQRYSTRYYFEGLSSLSILTALPIAWLAQRWSRRIVYRVISILLIASLYTYSIPRITTLYRFNQIGQPQIEAVHARRNGDGPVLVVVTGRDVRWRAFGSLMAVTSPYLDSEVVVAWDNLTPGVREQILARFPDRQVIEIDAAGNDAAFRD